MARVEHRQIGQIAEAEGAVDAHRIGQVGRANRQPFEGRACRGKPASRVVAERRIVAFGAVFPGVVADFVIVPDPDHRVLAMQFLQVLVGAVLRVALAVVGERDDFAWRLVRPHAIGLAVLVNVVAEVHHGLQVAALGHAAIGVKIAGDVIRAGDEGQPQAIDRRACGRSRARTPDRRGLARGHESVVVRGIRAQAAEVELDRVVGGGIGDDRAVCGQARERRIERDFVAQPKACLGTRAGSGKRLRTRPQDHRIGQRIAARDAVREPRFVENRGGVFVTVGTTGAQQRQGNGCEQQLASGERRHGRREEKVFAQSRKPRSPPRDSYRHPTG